MTIQRQLILDIIQTSEQHLTAEDIYNIAQSRIPNIAIATIYNSLNYLTDNMHIRRIKMAGEPDHYDKNLHPHDHIICDVCKCVEDISVTDIKTEIEDKYRIKVNFCEINVHYTCTKCCNM